jgi:predicted glycosyltransferase
LRVWIDLAAPPQVLFFRPVIQALQRDADQLLVTVRDFGRAPAIAARLGIAHHVAGAHGGQGSLAKGVAILRRVARLVALARLFQPHVAVGHNSYAQALAAAWLRVPLVTAMDFEHQPANHLSFRLAHRILVPEAFPAAAWRRFGAADTRVVRYPGVKEEVYLADFAPDPTFPAALELPLDRVIVTMRPAARSALYHRFENPLFDAALEHVAAQQRALVLLVGRAAADQPSRRANVRALRAPVDGANLAFWSDLVIGAGGTMTREAAVLGTPAYTLYAGKPIAVDDYLIERGRLERLASPADFARIRLDNKPAARSMARPDGLRHVVATIRAVGAPN